MSGPETKCPKCGEELSGDFKCHNPRCIASEDYWRRHHRPPPKDLRDTQKKDSVP